MELILRLASKAVTVFSVLVLAVALASPVYASQVPAPVCDDEDCYPVRVNPDGSFRCTGSCPAACGCSASSVPVAGGGHEYSCTCLPVLP